jgi:hypothetical protein
MSQTQTRSTIADPRSDARDGAVSRRSRRSRAERRPDPPDNSSSDAVAVPARDGRYDAGRAVRALYAEHGPALLAYAVRFTADRGRAEDVVQETFLRAWSQLPGLLDDARPARAWLLRVTRRLLIDAARAAHARPMLAQETRPRSRSLTAAWTSSWTARCSSRLCSGCPRHISRS